MPKIGDPSTYRAMLVPRDSADAAERALSMLASDPDAPRVTMATVEAQEQAGRRGREPKMPRRFDEAMSRIQQTLRDIAAGRTA